MGDWFIVLLLDYDLWRSTGCPDNLARLWHYSRSYSIFSQLCFWFFHRKSHWGRGPGHYQDLLQSKHILLLSFGSFLRHSPVQSSKLDIWALHGFTRNTRAIESSLARHNRLCSLWLPLVCRIWWNPSCWQTRRGCSRHLGVLCGLCLADILHLCSQIWYGLSWNLDWTHVCCRFQLFHLPDYLGKDGLVWAHWWSQVVTIRR